MKNSSVGLILAKSQSKRLPNKNTLDFNGEPMFVTNLRKCLKIFDKVYVSSDSPSILDIAFQVGAVPIKRPESLCGDTPNITVYQHALEFMDNPDYIVAVQANSPTVPEQLIYQVNELMKEGVEEVMTCHPDYSIYGSIWAIAIDKLNHYGDPYKPTPSFLVTDNSVDIHTEEDLINAKCQSKLQS